MFKKLLLFVILFFSGLACYSQRGLYIQNLKDTSKVVYLKASKYYRITEYTEQKKPSATGLKEWGLLFEIKYI